MEIESFRNKQRREKENIINNYLKIAMEALEKDEYRKAIDAVDNAFYIDINSEKYYLIDKKLEIIEKLRMNIKEYLKVRNVFYPLKFISIILQCSKNINNNITYKRYVEEVFIELLNYCKKEDVNDYVKEIISLYNIGKRFFISDNVEYLNGSMENLVKDYSNYLIKNIKYIEEAEEFIGWSDIYLTNNDRVIFLMNIYCQFDKLKESLELLDINIKELLDSVKGQIVIDLLRKNITKKGVIKHLLKYKQILNRYGIPSIFIDLSFRMYCNKEELTKIFLSFSELGELERSNEVYDFLRKEYDLELVPSRNLLEFYKRTRNLQDGVIYYRKILDKKNYNTEACIEFGEFLVSFIGVRQTIMEFDNYIGKDIKEKSLYVKLDLATQNKYIIELFNLIDRNFNKVLLDASAISYLDSLNTLIKNESNYYKDKYRGMLLAREIPLIFMEKGFGNNFNTEFLFNEFYALYKDCRKIEAKEYFKCIVRYFDYKKLNKVILVDYLVREDMLLEGVEYYSTIIKERNYNPYIILEKACFIKKLSSLEHSYFEFAKYIKKVVSLKGLEEVCILINEFELYQIRNNGYEMLDKYLSSIEYYKYILHFIYPLYKKGCLLTKELLIDQLIKNLSNYFDDEIVQAIEFIDRHYVIDIEEIVIILESIIKVKKFTVAEKVIATVRDEDDFVKLTKLKIEIYNELFMYKDIVSNCEKIIYKYNLKLTMDEINYYFKGLFNLKEYDVLMEKGQEYIKKIGSNISRKENYQIYSFMFKAAVNELDSLRAIKYFLKRYIITTRKKIKIRDFQY